MPVSTQWKNLQKICNLHIFSSLSRAAFDNSINLLSNTIFSVDLANPASDTAREFRDLVRSILEDAAKPNLSHFFPVLKMLDLQVTFARVVGDFHRVYSSNGSHDNRICLLREPIQRQVTQLRNQTSIGYLIYKQQSKKHLGCTQQFSLLLPRKASIDVEIAGFTVPKGAQVLVNVWAIGRDESTWDNPHSFMPERFLRTDLNFKGQNFELILFGAGRRICPGLPLAIRMLHLMLEKFDLTLQKARPLRVGPVAIQSHDLSCARWSDFTCLKYITIDKISFLKI
ncbi:cytochrome p450 family protein expressed [Citrus sinensis]|uniref:Cytochrome p450 family protein expressed n=1 Tax=Citrus sinensis TaxID=2711 RepID=A0ACB8KAM6_CITSI|nr:cytochrome p450 family protein expressed [Citrus sinensis]